MKAPSKEELKKAIETARKALGAVLPHEDADNVKELQEELAKYKAANIEMHRLNAENIKTEEALKDQLISVRAELKISSSEMGHLRDERRRLAEEIERQRTIIPVSQDTFRPEDPVKEVELLEVHGKISEGEDYFWIKNLGDGQIEVEIGHQGATSVRAEVPVEVITSLMQLGFQKKEVEHLDDELRSKIKIKGLG